MKRIFSPVFPWSVIQTMLDKRKRALEEATITKTVLPLSVYDFALDGLDSRVQDPSKRATWWHRTWGAMTRMYCVSCGKKSPYGVSETMIATVYQCNDCTMKYGDPPGLTKVAESPH
jgi:hypothetical protein